MQGRLLPRSRAARARHGARQRGEGKVPSRLGPLKALTARVPGISTSYELSTGWGIGQARAGLRLGPGKGEGPHSIHRRGHPEPDKQLAAAPGRPCRYDAGMYVALSKRLSCKNPIFGE